MKPASPEMRPPPLKEPLRDPGAAVEPHRSEPRDPPHRTPVAALPAPQAGDPRKGRAARWAVGLVVLAAVGAGIWFLVAHHGAGATEKGRRGHEGPTPVEVAEAHTGTLEVFLNGLGTVTPLNTVAVKTRVDGQIMSVGFVEGQKVEKDKTILFRIDSAPLKAQLAQAKGQKAKDEAQLANAVADLERYQQAPETVTQQQMDAAKAGVAQFKGAVQADDGQIQTINVQIGYCTITAPISGTVGLRSADEGNLVRASDSTPLAVITQMQPINVIFNLPEDDIPQIQESIAGGKKPKVIALDRDFSNVLGEGAFSAKDSQIDSASGTLRIKGLFENEKLMLYPNQFINVRLLVRTVEKAVLVDSAAIQLSPKGAFVYVVGKGNKVEMRMVKVGPTEGNLTQVVEGLEEGDVVAVSGVDKLVPGSEVSFNRNSGESTTQPSTQPGAATNPSSRPGGPARKDGQKSGAGNQHKRQDAQ